MLYLVSVSGIDEGTDFYSNDDNMFVVRADNEQTLASAIINYGIEHDDLTLADLNESVWRIRELGDEFDYQIAFDFATAGKRI